MSSNDGSTGTFPWMVKWLRAQGFPPQIVQLFLLPEVLEVLSGMRPTTLISEPAAGINETKQALSRLNLAWGQENVVFCLSAGFCFYHEPAMRREFRRAGESFPYREKDQATLGLIHLKKRRGLWYKLLSAPVLTGQAAEKISRLCILTCRRAQDITLRLKEYAENFTAFGHEGITVTVVDDSPPAAAAENQAQLAALKGRLPFRLRYLGPAERRLFIADACRKGLDKDALAVIFGKGIGASRNLILCLLRERLLMADDDASPYTMLPLEYPVNTPSNWKKDFPMIHDKSYNRADFLAQTEPLGVDFLSAHSRLLSVSAKEAGIKGFARDYGPARVGLEPVDLSDGIIRLTVSHVCGDLDYNLNEVVQQAIDCAGDDIWLGQLCNKTAPWKVSAAAFLTAASHAGTIMGVDNRTQILPSPPTRMPLEDLFLGYLGNILFPGSLVACAAVALFHQQSSTRPLLWERLIPWEQGLIDHIIRLVLKVLKEEQRSGLDKNPHHVLHKAGLQLLNCAQDHMLPIKELGRLRGRAKKLSQLLYKRLSEHKIPEEESFLLEGLFRISKEFCLSEADGKLQARLTPFLRQTLREFGISFAEWGGIIAAYKGAHIEEFSRKIN